MLKINNTKNLIITTSVILLMIILLSGCSALLKITAPADSIYLGTLKPKFVWEFNRAQDAIEYNIKIAEDPAFNKNVKEFKTTEPWLYLSIPYLKKSKQYFWTVKAVYNDSKVGKTETDWAYLNADTKTPFSFSVAQNAVGDFGFEEGQKEEINKLGNLENIRRLTWDDKNERFPAVSKDGKKVAFCSDKLGNVEIFVKILSEGGTGEIQRTFSTTGQDNYCPFWMSDNDNFMFYSNRNNTTSAFNLFETTKGKGLTVRHNNSFIPPVEELTGTCMDNDRKVVYTEKTNNNPVPVLWFMNLNENSYTQLVPGIFPDMRNQVIVFCSKKSGNFNIWTMRLEGNSIYDETQLTYGDDFCYDPSWSPDGDRIAFVSHKSGNSDVWVMDADGQNATQITFNPLVDRWPRWKDNETIIFQSNREKNKSGSQGWDLWQSTVLKK